MIQLTTPHVRITGLAIAASAATTTVKFFHLRWSQ
jgi:hypothetical protein